MNEERRGTAFLFDVVSIITSAAVIVAVAFIFLFRTVGVNGSSMYPTLHDRDRIILTAFARAKQGEIVVTCQPSKYDYIEPTLVKRVIAVSGQRVDIDFDKGVVYVDDKVMDEPYINELTRDREDFNGPIIVPDGYVFVMGDNRNASTDSRDNRVGLIREEYILGRALFRLVPFGQFKIG